MKGSRRSFKGFSVDTAQALDQLYFSDVWGLPMFSEDLYRLLLRGSSGFQLIEDTFDYSDHMVQISIPGTEAFFPLCICMSSERRPLPRSLEA